MAFKNITPPWLDRHKSGCPVPSVDSEPLPACEASRETVIRVLMMRADRRSHSGLISAFSHHFKTADVMLLLDFSLLGLTTATGRTHGAQSGFMSSSVQFAGMNQVCVLFEEKFLIARIPVRHVRFP